MSSTVPFHVLPGSAPTDVARAARDAPRWRSYRTFATTIEAGLRAAWQGIATALPAAAGTGRR